MWNKCCGEINHFHLQHSTNAVAVNSDLHVAKFVGCFTVLLSLLHNRCFILNLFFFNWIVLNNMHVLGSGVILYCVFPHNQDLPSLLRYFILFIFYFVVFLNLFPNLYLISSWRLQTIWEQRACLLLVYTLIYCCTYSAWAIPFDLPDWPLLSSLL